MTKKILNRIEHFIFGIGASAVFTGILHGKLDWFGYTISIGMLSALYISYRIYIQNELILDLAIDNLKGTDLLCATQELLMRKTDNHIAFVNETLNNQADQMIKLIKSSNQGKNDRS